MGVLLRLTDASFGYGGRAIVAGVDLEVGPGQFLGIVGPNGAGKTTLLRALGLLERPAAGELTLFGERIRQIEAKALRKLRHPSRSKKLKDYLE